MNANTMRQYLSILALMSVMMLPANLVTSAPVLPPLNSSHTGKAIPGKFIWFELATVDVEKQKSFYGDVFGWSFQTINKKAEQYTLIKNGQRNVAGLFQVEPRKETQLGALWIGMMSVQDPNTAVAAVKQLGGSVHTPPTELPNRGTYALLRDPEGALFGILKSSSGDSPDREIENGNIFWMDLFVKNISAATEFYKKLAGYEVVTNDEAGAKRTFLRSSDKFRAGIVPLPDDANRAGWLPYVKVEDVTETLKKIEAAGGIIMVSPDKSLLDGNLAIFADPLGGIMGIVKWGPP